MSPDLPPPVAKTGVSRDDVVTAAPAAPRLLQDAFEAAGEALLVVEAGSGAVITANRAGVALLGAAAAAVVGQPLAAFAAFPAAPELWAECLRLAPGAGFSGRALQLTAADGHPRTFRLAADGFASGGRAFVRLSLHDVTAGQIRERRAQQARKMESVRLLAGSAAHDFNNVLSCIRGYVSIALETAGIGGEVREILTRVKDVTLRAGELPQRLLDFSRQRKLTLQPLDLSQFVRTLGPELRAGLPEGVALQLHAGDSVTVNADETMLRLALTLLFRNAREALGEHGEITLSAARWSLPAPAERTAGGPETYARLSVRDSGRGMTAEIQERLFEPGFTTKKSGRNAGMSLSTVYRIAVQHGGWMEVTSAPGAGATFTMVLPLAAAPAA